MHFEKNPYFSRKTTQITGFHFKALNGFGDKHRGFHI
jgi:hypothetical protein